MSENELVVGPEASTSSQKTSKAKTAPMKTSIPTPFSYSPSHDGIDENLLVLLHGLGDTEAPFAKLGQQLRLPQTAILSLRAPQRIPYLYEDAFQWYESFDQLGELLTNPNPTPALDVMDRVLDHLIDSCGWTAGRIHLFGFAQGGSVVAECALRRWKRQPDPEKALASVVSIEGPLLSFPTSKQLSPTALLFFHRSPRETEPSAAAYRKGFVHVNVVRVGGEAGMPRNKEEWGKIIEFWSRVLATRLPDMPGLHPVLSGAPTFPQTL